MINNFNMTENTNWKYIGVDDHRKVSINTANYDKFQLLLDNVEDIPIKSDQFSRPQLKNIPVPSFGIIAVSVDDEYNKSTNTNTTILSYYVSQRRSTVEFAETLRCGPRKENLFEYFSSLTKHEKELLKNISDNLDVFDKTWNDFLLDDAQFFIKTQSKIKKIFGRYVPYLSMLLDLTENHTKEPSWGFPKGRAKTTDQTRLQSALREFTEESRIEVKNIELLWPEPIIDTYRGTDGCLYSTTYYVIKLPNKISVPLIESPGNLIHDRYLSHEMVNYRWIPFEKGKIIEKGTTTLPKRLEKILINLHNNLNKKSN